MLESVGKEIDRFRFTWRDDNLCSQDDMHKLHILNIIFSMERDNVLHRVDND